MIFFFFFFFRRGGGAEYKKGDLSDPKCGPSEPYPLNSLTKTQFLANFVPKGGPFGRFGVALLPVTPSLPSPLYWPKMKRVLTIEVKSRIRSLLDHCETL